MSAGSLPSSNDSTVQNLFFISRTYGFPWYCASLWTRTNLSGSKGIIGASFTKDASFGSHVSYMNGALTTAKTEHTFSL